MPDLSERQCAELHRCLLEDMKQAVSSVSADLFVAYSHYDESGKEVLEGIFGSGALYLEQEGSGLGVRLRNAFADVFQRGYHSCILIGGDIPEITSDIIEQAFQDALDADVVIGPAVDGGYYLVGMNQVIDEAFALSDFGHNKVCERTVSSLQQAECRIRFGKSLHDVDRWEDLILYQRRLTARGLLGSTATSRYIEHIGENKASKAV